jgi:polyketide cyclase/dehydrase/lipid transport protein
MKILLILAVAVVLFILAVVLTGSLLPKRHVVSRSASYRATPERLFSLIAGDQKWRPELLRSEPVADTGGSELIRETTRDGETITYETLERTPPLSLKRRIATKNLPYSGSWSYSLAPNGDATVVRITEDGEVYNPAFRFMSRFVIGHTRSMDNFLRALGKAVGQDVQITD